MAGAEPWCRRRRTARSKIWPEDGGVSHAAPVVDASGELVGMVTEGDCLRRAELGTERKRSMWRTFLAAQGTLAEEYIRSHARKVADVMTRDPITIGRMPISERSFTSWRSIASSAVPVVKDGAVVGNVSRANLVQAMAGLLRGGTWFIRTTSPSARRALRAGQASVGRQGIRIRHRQGWRGRPVGDVYRLPPGRGRNRRGGERRRREGGEEPSGMGRSDVGLVVCSPDEERT